MKKYLANILFASLTCFILTLSANAQTAEAGPADKVCISRDAAIKAVETAAERDALKDQLKTEQQAVEAMRAELNEMRVKFAAASGELSGLKQNAVQDRAIIDILLKNVRPKKIGLINF